MGVPRLIKSLSAAVGDDVWLKNVVTKVFNGEVATLSIDANSIFHTAAQVYRKLGAGRIAKSIALSIDLIVQLIRKYSPTHAVIIAVDGPPPRAKIEQQRARRYLSASAADVNDDYDGNMITPGSPYMLEMAAELKKAISTTRENFLVPSLIYSGHTTPGEGEHKIFKHLKECATKNPNMNGAHLIIGNDSDLTLIAMLCVVSNIHIVDIESPQLTIGADIPLMQTSSGRPKDGKVLNVNVIKKLIQAKLGNTATIDDFVFAMSLVGNDFLPRPLALSSIEVSTLLILNVLRKMEGAMPTLSGSIHIAGVLNFIRSMARDEIDGINEVSDLWSTQSVNDDGFVAYKCRVFAETLGNTDISDADITDAIRNKWYTHALSPNRSTVLKTIQDEDIAQMTAAYIQGLSWVYAYYSTGQDSVTWMWYYPYYYAPMLHDLNTLMDAADPAYLDEIMNTGKYEGETSVNSLVQLLCVMPARSIEHVPQQIVGMYSNPRLIASFPSSILVDRDLIPMEHMEVVILPHSPYHKVIVMVSALKPADLKEHNNVSHTEYNLSQKDMQVLRSEQINIGRIAGAGRGRGQATRSRVSPVATRGRGSPLRK